MLTPRIKLPLVAAQQAQKHVTVNEALLRLDAFAGLTAIDVMATPPEAPAGDGLWIVGTDPAGAWSGRQSQLARLDMGAWDFIEPLEGQLLYLTTRRQWWSHQAGTWSPTAFSIGSLAINTAPDQQHVLALSGATSFFNHHGADHRVMINKASQPDTATLIFQSNYQGAAELGLAGNDDLRVKTSGDGATWREAMVVERSSAIVRMPQRPAFFGTLLNWDRYYNAGDRLEWNARVNRGQMLNGAGNAIALPASGLYLVTLTAISRDLSTLGNNYLGAYLNGALSSQTVVLGSAITPMIMQIEATAGDELDIRSAYGANARYWPETMLNVAFCG